MPVRLVEAAALIVACLSNRGLDIIVECIPELAGSTADILYSIA